MEVYYKLEYQNKATVGKIGRRKFKYWCKVPGSDEFMDDKRSALAELKYQKSHRRDTKFRLIRTVVKTSSKIIAR